ncbi:MAG: bifunctional glutamate N-acetyltransferase/amino-acid acetyltransferase ArgJ [Rhodobacteraceae bacterium]|nr:bifunctional glutamate N-acetyltransferase/amino-acid acetyltransferase ArgJ [Paracoccaceae bacterium]
MAKKTGKQIRAEIKKLKTRKLKNRLKKLRALTEAESAAEPQTVGAPVVSPLAPEGGFPAIPPIAGVGFATAAAGVRYAGRTDVLLVRLAPGTTLAGVFTRSATRSAAVLDGQAKIGRDSDAGAAIVVNSGNANTFTGAAGVQAVQAIVQATAAALDLPAERVFTSSTGVIGEDLPVDRITGAMDTLVTGLTQGASAEDAARAIMTTDTFAKGSCAELPLGNGRVRIAGIAKGSGMIAPDMATMLAYVFTDARVDRAVLQEMLRRTTDRSFNRISVDSDTSTSDTVLLAATGQAEAPAITDIASPEGRAFAAALEVVMADLAQQVVRDGEGATKFVEVQVTGAADEADAHKVARAIADSPLVKTALAGEDPNWGRIVMAVGKSGARADRDRLAIRLGPLNVAEAGRVAPAYAEAEGAAYMRRAELVIGVDLGLGQGTATVWTCDLTHRYIDINADYRS